VTARVGLGQNW